MKVKQKNKTKIKYHSHLQGRLQILYLNSKVTIIAQNYIISYIWKKYIFILIDTYQTLVGVQEIKGVSSQKSKYNPDSNYHLTFLLLILCTKHG